MVRCVRCFPLIKVIFVDRFMTSIAPVVLTFKYNVIWALYSWNGFFRFPYGKPTTSGEAIFKSEIKRAKLPTWIFRCIYLSLFLSAKILFCLFFFKLIAINMRAALLFRVNPNKCRQKVIYAAKSRQRAFFDAALLCFMLYLTRNTAVFTDFD